MVLAYVNNNHYQVPLPLQHQPQGETLYRHRNRRRARVRATRESTTRHYDKDDGHENENRLYTPRRSGRDRQLLPFLPLRLHHQRKFQGRLLITLTATPTVKSYCDTL